MKTIQNLAAASMAVVIMAVSACHSSEKKPAADSVKDSVKVAAVKDSAKTDTTKKDTAKKDTVPTSGSGTSGTGVPSGPVHPPTGKKSQD